MRTVTCSTSKGTDCWLSLGKISEAFQEDRLAIWGYLNILVMCLSREAGPQTSVSQEGLGHLDDLWSIKDSPGLFTVSEGKV